MMTNPNEPWLDTDYDPYKGMDDQDRMLAGCLHIVIFIVGMMVMLVIAALCNSCTTTKYVEVERTKTDTCYVTQHQRDSIYIEKYRHDSVSIQQRGDTVFVNKWLTVYQDQWRDRVVHDSIYLSKTDTLNLVKVEVREKPLTPWQRTRMACGTASLVIVAFGIVICFIRRILKKQ
jgi:hypothetical protein